MADSLQILFQSFSREIAAGLRQRGALSDLAEDLTKARPCLTDAPGAAARMAVAHGCTARLGSSEP